MCISAWGAGTTSRAVRVREHESGSLQIGLAAPLARGYGPSIERLRVLFICSRNQWRSPTAERVFGKDPRLSVRSRGLAKSARRKLSAADVEWAQLIAVMEDAHADRLCESFELGATQLAVLDIPDDYRAMDPELVEMLRDGMTSVLAKLLD